MALNSYAMSGGANVTVGPTPIAVQVTGPTIVITNYGLNTAFGSCGGSASATLNIGAISGFAVGQGVGGSGGSSTNLNPGAGIAITPLGSAGNQAILAVGNNGWLWLQTMAGNTVVNVANGT